jgi:4-hydroxy-L-threonine phosphate dehydrogenase PdxA
VLVITEGDLLKALSFGQKFRLDDSFIRNGILLLHSFCFATRETISAVMDALDRLPAVKGIAIDSNLTYSAHVDLFYERILNNTNITVLEVDAAMTSTVVNMVLKIVQNNKNIKHIRLLDNQTRWLTYLLMNLRHQMVLV